MAIRRPLVDAHSQHAGVPLVERHAVLNVGARGHVALQASVDDVRRHAEARNAPLKSVFRGWLPGTGHHVVAGGLGCLWGHPEPDRGLEREDGVVRELGSILKQHVLVPKHELAEGAIIIVPAELNGPPALVGLAADAWVLLIVHLAVLAATAAPHLLTPAIAPGQRPTRRGGPPSGCLMARLPEPRCQLNLVQCSVPRVGKGRKVVCRVEECLVGKEVCPCARRRVHVGEELVEVLVAEPRPDA
mmetsp:Transcript_106901/g.312543  ORF Transcript_106901/g.312543 Transcript_106901/m.312543 type:complete len:245 (+) Transcript_106901:302-1036(+)